MACTANETTPFSISYVTVPSDEVAKKLAQYANFYFQSVLSVVFQSVLFVS